jgi:hypothetical protein
MINRIVGKRKRDDDPVTIASFQHFEDQVDFLSPTTVAPTILKTEQELSSFNTVLDDRNFGDPLATGNKRTRVTATTVSSSSSSSLVNNPPPTKKDTKPSGKVKIPLKDIRRNYPHIFARAFNACEKEILRYCLTKYCMPDCLLVYKYVGPPSKWTGSDYLEIHGVDAILKFWEVFFLAFPDSIFEIEESKLRVLPTGSCSSVSKFIYFGTKVYQLSVDNEANAVIYKQPADALSAPLAMQGAMPAVPPVEGSSRIVSMPREPSSNPSAASSAVPQDFGLAHSLEKPEVMIIIGTFSLFVNPEKQIYKIEFVHSLKQS